VPRAALAALDWLVVNESEPNSWPATFAERNRCALRRRRIAKTGGTTVIVTLGGGRRRLAGAVAWTIGTLPITPVDTTAAGDAFVGAFAAATDSGADLPTALHRASVAGGLACTIAGAQPSLPMKAAIESRLRDLAPARPG
jgi:ribokinase